MICREATLWRQLYHPNVLPFIGVDRVTFNSCHALVSPWLNNGNILVDAASGLAYLHSQNIVHGDLRALFTNCQQANILVNDRPEACISDFGLSIVSSATAALSTVGQSNVRWLPRELLEGTERFPTYQSDVYAFGHVCGEAYTTKAPFWKIKIDGAIVCMTIQGQTMPRPASDECPGPNLSDRLWAFMQQCWNSVPSARPSAADVVREMRLLHREEDM
ncbi:kinase-like protein [Punctularia strigosozonata HHB-11173 SS5]|uniref:kinase-like protein n=1 Tax=Punctularia strigosozonata (strain HHB-11173) TaxID=741275 RepID=UPI00044184B0|nr:kinase-like protein [Punctularia strigosozonata HHB-11173 SS5]EIN12521.1 kinase-like protein [Punctularia strigosozonata HHB-11173 SS5]